MIPQESRKSRLEVNFTRLLNEAEQIASGNKGKDWKFEKNDRRLLILYGSQTGTAEEVAERIVRECQKYYFVPLLLPMNECPISGLLHNVPTIFITSTTGQGDDPDNMRDFFQDLWENRQNKQLLSGLQFGLLGLGDSSYQKFNFSAKRLNKLLCLLGAKPLMNIGLADDQHDLGPDFVIDSWLKNLWQILNEYVPLPEGVEPIKESILSQPSFEVKFLEDNCESSNSIQDLPKEMFKASIMLNSRRTSEDHFQDVRLIEFDVSDSDYVHKPGDVLMIQPENLDEFVNEFLSVLDLDGNKLFTLIPSKSKRISSHILSLPCTIRECVKRYFDIMSVPKRYFFELLSFFTTDEMEREKFVELASSEGQEELYAYCNRPKRSILEVLSDFPHVNRAIPFEYLFDLIPVIKPRAYSIASSSKALPNKAQILMSVVNYKTILRRPRLGVCSNWLANLELGSSVLVWFKAGSLRFPDPVKECPPVIMIGPGTGCAPFRSYIQERVAYNNFSNLIMIFGCRGRDKDYFFKDEWEDLNQEGKLMLLCAFSRDQEEKIYVQHVMKENINILGKHLCNDATKVFYAGNAKRIPIDVHEVLQYISEKTLNLSEEEAEKYMKLNLDKRYQTESWT